MANQSSLGPFVDSDVFFRRFDRKRHVDEDGTVSQEVFKGRPSETELSFTYKGVELSTPEEIRQYQVANALLYGDLPGICKLTYRNLTIQLEPPLEPRAQPDLEDEFYGHLHCATDVPRGLEHREKLAKLAEGHGVVCRFEKKPKRST